MYRICETPMYNITVFYAVKQQNNYVQNIQRIYIHIIQSRNHSVWTLYFLYLYRMSLCPYATVSVVSDNKNLLSS